MAEAQESSHTGVRKYFFFTKENVSSDWKDLAFHLGFRQADIDNIDGRNRDDNPRCMDLLEEWVKRRGERATIEVLVEALSEANLQSTVDGLKNKYPELNAPQPTSSQQKTTEERDRLSAKKEAHCEEEISIEDTFQKSIRNYYEVKLTKFKPLIWNDNFTLTLSDLFTELELITTRDKGSGLAAEIKRLDDLFNTTVTHAEQAKATRCILIEAKPGGGKTTFMSKEALDAVTLKSELGRRYDIVLLTRLREVREGETIEEMVWDQCVPETTQGVDVPAIKAILQRNEFRVLFLLDGYDELRPEARADTQAIPKLLSGKLYPKSTIVITSRPSAGVQQYAQPDCHARIIGFSFELVEKYVRQYFTSVGKQDLAEKLTDVVLLEDNDLLRDLVKTPIFLLLVCLLWEENEEMVSTGTMTGLYGNLMTCLVKKHCKREGLDIPDGIPSDLDAVLLQLGKLALEALLRKETQLDLAEVERQNVNWKLLLKIGVVFSETSASKLHPRKQLTFAHKTMQEFLAGRYVGSVVGSQDIEELLQLTSLNEVFENSNLLLFSCGCNSRAAQAVVVLAHLMYNEFTNSNKQTTKSDQPEETESEMYKRYVLLCLSILNERTGPEVLQTVSEALPCITLQNYSMDRKQHAALKYFLQNLQPSSSPCEMGLKVDGFSLDYRVVQYMEQTFTCSTPGLKLDLVLSESYLHSPEETSRLVSVLKNVPGLRALVLTSANLTPEKLQVLVRGLKHMSLLEDLSLVSNPELGDAGMEVLQVGLDCVPHLTVLFIYGCNITDVSMASLAPYLGKLSRLRELDLGNNKIGNTGLVPFITVFSTFVAMQELGLSRNGISPAGMRTLAPALRHLTGLTKLDISSNEIGDSGVECLADILPCLTAMKVLELERTGIGDKGISALVKPLPSLVALQELDVRDNIIGESSVVSLVRTLCQPSGLDMEQNQTDDKSLATDQGNTTPHEPDSEEISEATGEGQEPDLQLSTALPKLAKLNMSNKYQLENAPVHLSDTAAIAVAEAVPRLPALECLGLGEFSMEAAGFQALVQAAEEHPKLRELTYTKELVPEGVETSSRCLKKSWPWARRRTKLRAISAADHCPITTA
ncbi:NLR family CARD domain-containing protein 4-like [Branchiostoma lanceolatum]|uniref:NLR family CARD domain-containing protein 4-like n=1 Tax=Branchiostoma lanceolatum TaxID=7740 RepID=UPI0034570620